MEDEMRSEQTKILIEDLLASANEILGDFDSFNEVLQRDEDGVYGPTSGIEKLRMAVQELENHLEA
jgi:hypothetical protein